MGRPGADGGDSSAARPRSACPAAPSSAASACARGCSRSAGRRAPPRPEQQVRPGRGVRDLSPQLRRGRRAPTWCLISSSGQLRRHRGGRSHAAQPGQPRLGFDDYTNVVTIGDWNGDGYQDVAGRTAGADLRLFRSTGSGLAVSVGLGRSADHRAMTGVGDPNGDTRPDLVVMTTANTCGSAGDGERTGAGSRSVAPAGRGRTRPRPR